MSQHVSMACDEGTWVPLIEYSIKSGLSLSTIRRKIKSNSIPYRLDKGKYFILYSERDAVLERDESQVAIPRPTERPVTRPSISPRYADRKLTPLESEDSFAQKPFPYREPKLERSPEDKMTQTFERLLDEKQAQIEYLERKTRELETRITELQLLVKVLEEKYDVRY